MARLPFYQPFTSTSVWNLPIANGATFESANDVRTAALINTGVTAWLNSEQYSHPITQASSSDPLATVTDTNDASRSATYRVPVNAVIAPGSDKHMHIVSPDGKTIDEAFLTVRNSSTSYSVGRHERVDLYGNGIGPSNGTRAYGGSAIGGLIRKWEVDPTDPNYTGRIDHPLAIAITNSQLRYTSGGYGYNSDGTGKSLGYVWPATEQDYDSPATYTGIVPMGTYAAIPPSVDITTLGLTSWGLMMAKALQDYGAYVTDRSGSFAFYAEPGVNNDFFVGVLGPNWTASDINKLRAQLRIATNNTSTTPNAGTVAAARRQAIAAALVSTEPVITPPTITPTGAAVASQFAGYTADTVLDTATGLPVVNVVVNLYIPDTTQPAVKYTTRTRTAIINEVRTDADGWYSCFVAPGFYDRKIGNTTHRIRVNEDDADTVSFDQGGQPGGFAQLDSNSRIPLANMPIGVGTGGSTGAGSSGIVDLATVPGFDLTGTQDMWQFLTTMLPSWAIQKKQVVIGSTSTSTTQPALLRIALSRGIDLYDGTNIKVIPKRPKWMYKGEPPFAFIPMKDAEGNAAFESSYMLRYAEPSLRGGSGAANSCYLENVVAYGAFTSNAVNTDGTPKLLGGVDGLVVEGQTYGLVTENCGFRSFEQCGVRYKPTVNQDGTGKNSLGHRHVDLGTERIGYLGLDTDGLTDSDIIRHHAHTCGNTSSSATAGSVHIRGAGDLKYLEFRHTFCKRGIVTGNSSITQGRPNSHSIKIESGNSDRMQFGAFEHRAFGTRLWSVKDCTFGRDGRNEAHGTDDAITSDEYGSWAVRCDGGTSQSCAPIRFDGCDIQFGVDDSYGGGTDRNPYTSPAVGIVIGRIIHVAWNGGTLAGKVHPYHFNGNNVDKKDFKISANTSMVTGTVDAPVFTYYDPTIMTPAA